jgi:uncharacterized protein involved in exopolysaccharide biosynthesis
MHRRPWPLAALLTVVIALGACGDDRKAGTEQLAGDLAQVKADRDQLAAQVKQLSDASATLEAYTVNDRQGCLRTLSTVRQRLHKARAALSAGKADSKDAAVHLGRAIQGLDDASRGKCAPATP